MQVTEKTWGKLIEVDVLIMGTGAAGMGAALRAAGLGADVLMAGKGRLESSGCLGGGNDHYMCVLNTDAPFDTRQDFIEFYLKSTLGYTPGMLGEWFDALEPCLRILEEVGTEFRKNPDGSYYRSVGFGQPGAWWLHIANGQSIKRALAKKIRKAGVSVLDHFQITRLYRDGDRFSGCVGFNVLTGEVSAIRCRTGVMALGFQAVRATNNSTHNPYNVWFSPYNTGSYFVLPFDIGAAVMNVDIYNRATLLPKGWGAPGMNGINNMGGHELNALGERFMGKYDPMMENGKRRNQVAGTVQEQVEGNGPPFYMDMRHFKPEDADYLQNVLMPADKATYGDYRQARGIDFKKAPLEVEVSELSLAGFLHTDDRLETPVRGLYAACNFNTFSGSMSGGYASGRYAAETAHEAPMGQLDEADILAEKARILGPMQVGAQGAMSYDEFEEPIRQVMDYYAKFRRNMPGMELALDKLALIETYENRVRAENLHDLMRTHEAFELLQMCRLHLLACLQRRETGRGMYHLADYPALDPKLGKALVMRKIDNEVRYGWGVLPD